MKRYSITIGEHTYDVRVLDDPRQPTVRVQVDGEVLNVETGAAQPAEIATPLEPVPATGHSAAPAPSAAPAAPSNTVAAPLPGVIKSIAVQPGQQVAPNQELLVIEAMKMDNVIRASRSGTVDSISVTRGQQVAYGEPLLKYRGGS